LLTIVSIVINGACYSNQSNNILFCYTIKLNFGSGRCRECLYF